MMTIPQGQYVITETAVGTPVTTVNTGQVKAVTQVRKTIIVWVFLIQNNASGLKPKVWRLKECQNDDWDTERREWRCT